jgi:hypothetical protein
LSVEKVKTKVQEVKGIIMGRGGALDSPWEFGYHAGP